VPVYLRVPPVGFDESQDPLIAAIDRGPREAVRYLKNIHIQTMKRNTKNKNRPKIRF
jgi:hypothetical protein